MSRRLRALGLLSLVLGLLVLLGALRGLPLDGGPQPARAASGAGGPTAPPATGGRLVLALSLPRAAALTRYVEAVNRPGSPQFHHFLTPAGFARRFGATGVQVSALRRALAAAGMDGFTLAPDRLYATVRAPVARRGQLVSRLAQGLRGLVSAVITTQEMPTLHPQLSPPARGVAAPGTGDPGVDGGASPCPGASLDGGYTAPQLARAYDFNGLYARGLHGEGMSAAVLEFGGYHSANIADFEHCYGLHTAVSRQLVDGGSGAPANSSETEVALDIEVLMEMAPRIAHISVIEAPNDGTGELAAYSAFVDAAHRDPVLSVSWGECEQGASQSYERLLARIVEQAAAQGQQIFIASGDSGAKGCAAEPLPTGGSLSAETEASLPWVTGVGGTDLSQATTEQGATVHREEVWNDGLGAGGGGQSVVWAMPGWQRSYLAASGDRPDGMSDPCRAPAGQGCRMVPDIALDADGEEGGADARYWGVPQGPMPAQFSYLGDRGSPGYSIFCASADCSGGGSPWSRVGGTSAATPLAAAAAVLWDEEARRAGVGLGFLNPALYAVAENPVSYHRDFHDPTLGTNDDHFTELSCVAGCARLYRAGRGYDMATGLGSLDVGNLGPDLVAQSGGLNLTPDATHLYGYTHGGPATTAPVSVTGGPGNATAWSASANVPWLRVGATGATPASLVWHADPRGLAPGTYHGTITVTATDGTPATLTVTYTVTPPARIALLTRSLHFHETQIRPAGRQRVAVCGAPLWGDELESHGSLPGVLGLSVPGDETSQARRVLAFTNRGARGSQLHFSIDQTHVAWISNDFDPHGRPGAVPLRPGQPLVPSEGSLGRGGHARIHLASIANANLLGGDPALQQGTYHGTIVIRDLADPRDVARVPVTLTLGDGRGTPRIGAERRRLGVTLAPGRHRELALRLTDPGGRCGYGESIQTDASWLEVAPDRRAGHVGPGGLTVPVIVRAPAGAGPRTLHATIAVASLNAANAQLRIPVALRVR
ncbi:MAG TPA: protease pro-enzyme activation domain-containing protein [Solirubrobacteraceae bacterium]|nr:protease pro-enzyme activation domain-containing protein [Solirubrobacteraceae bacterium]